MKIEKTKVDMIEMPTNAIERPAFIASLQIPNIINVKGDGAKLFATVIPIYLTVPLNGNTEDFIEITSNLQKSDTTIINIETPLDNKAVKAYISTTLHELKSSCENFHRILSKFETNCTTYHTRLYLMHIKADNYTYDIFNSGNYNTFKIPYIFHLKKAQDIKFGPTANRMTSMYYFIKDNIIYKSQNEDRSNADIYVHIKENNSPIVNLILNMLANEDHIKKIMSANINASVPLNFSPWSIPMIYSEFFILGTKEKIKAHMTYMNDCCVYTNNIYATVHNKIN